MELVIQIIGIYIIGFIAVSCWNLVDDFTFYKKHGQVSFEHNGRFNFKEAFFFGCIWPIIVFFTIKVFFRKILSYFKSDDKNGK